MKTSKQIKLLLALLVLIVRLVVKGSKVLKDISPDKAT